MSLKDTLSLRLLCLKRPQNHNNKCKRASPPKKNVKSPKKYVQGLASKQKCANFAQKL